jgi:hypothetical protein
MHETGPCQCTGRKCKPWNLYAAEAANLGGTSKLGEGDKCHYRMKTAL